MARTTSEVVLYADTAQRVAVAPGERFTRDIPPTFGLEDARRMALSLLREKATRRGANPDNTEFEVIEEHQFNMVRDFYTIGKNIRTRVQIKPGLIRGYDPFKEALDA